MNYASIFVCLHVVLCCPLNFVFCGAFWFVCVCARVRFFYLGVLCLVVRSKVNLAARAARKTVGMEDEDDGEIRM